jgi:hypothetical protein
MKSRISRIALTTLLVAGAIQAQEAFADGPPPAPVIAVSHMAASGNDLIVTLSAETATSALPPTASLEVTDANDDTLTIINFTPMPGEQMVSVPGVLAPQPSDMGEWPLQRNLDVFGGPYEEIYAETGISVLAPAGPVVSTPRRPAKKAQYCYLHLISIHCYETESFWSGDDAYLKLNGNEIWRDSNMNAGDDDTIDRWFLMGETAGPFKLELFDDDSPDADDWLGTLTVPREKTVVSRHFDFTEDGAHYRLYYEVRCFKKPLPGII